MDTSQLKSLEKAGQAAVAQPPQERIAASAIQQDGVTYTGPHHSDIIRQIVGCGGRRPVTGTQGFITNRNRFVERPEAAQIALAAGQIDKLRYSRRDLFSEELWSVPLRSFYMETKLREIREHVAEFGNSVGADLETGSHHLNNDAAEEFSAKYPKLLKWVRDLQTLTDPTEDFSPGPHGTTT